MNTTIFFIGFVLGVLLGICIIYLVRSIRVRTYSGYNGPLYDGTGSVIGWTGNDYTGYTGRSRSSGELITGYTGFIGMPGYTGYTGSKDYEDPEWIEEKYKKEKPKKEE